MSANNKLSRAEVMLDNLKREHQLLKESEGRLVKEKEVMLREQQLHSSLMASIESIKVSVDRSELEGKIRLEKRLDEAQKECSALRRRLQVYNLCFILLLGSTIIEGNMEVIVIRSLLKSVKLEFFLWEMIFGWASHC